MLETLIRDLASGLASIKDVSIFIFEKVNTYWNVLAPIAILIGAACSASPLARWLREKALLKRCAQPLHTFFEVEKNILRDWPSLVTESSIDFAVDYVSLVMIEQRRSGILAVKRAVDVDQVINGLNPIAIVSGPGCGKTMLLLHIQYRLLTKNSHYIRYHSRSIPIVLHASRVADSDASLPVLIAKKLEILKDDAKQFVELGLIKGWFVLLIDGVDEITKSIPEFVNKICRFTSHYKSCHVIMASRPVSYDLENLTNRLVRPFQEIAIAPLSMEKKKALVAKYAKNPRDAAEVIRLISTQPFMAQITRVTINLMLLIDLVSHAEEISQRSDFYFKAVRLLLSNLPKGKEGKNLKYTPAQKIELLARVSFDGLVNGRPFDMETVSISGDESNFAEQIFEEIQQTSGLIKMAPRERFTFPHRTFAEYFAACYVHSHYKMIKDEEWARIFKNDTSEIVAFVANLMENVDPLIERVMKFPNNRSRGLADCLANCRQVTLASQERAEQVIWTALKDSPDVQIQSSAARYILSQIHNFPRREDYKTLYLQLQERLAAPECYAMDSGVPIEDIQTQALQLLVHTNSPEIVPDLVEVFNSGESDTYVRFKAGELLASLSSEELLPDLRHAYFDNRDVDVRRFVTEAIVRTKSKEAVSLLDEALGDEDPVIRDLAKEGIKQITEGSYLEDATIPILTGGEKSEKSYVPGCDLSPKDLLSLAVERDPRYRLDAFFQLRNSCPEECEAELCRVAMDGSENEFYRCEAVRLLGTRTGDTFADYLERVFKETREADPGVGAGARGCAIEYLAHRKRRAHILRCIQACDIRSALPSEKCKIVWAIYEIVHIGGIKISKAEQCDIERACADSNCDLNPRIDHWKRRIEHYVHEFAS